MAITWTQPELLVAKAAGLLTETAPTAATAGISLKHVTSLTIVLEAEDTRTLTGGAVQAYFYDPVVGAWARLPAVEPTLGNPATRRAAYAIATTLLPRRGRVAFIGAGVTVSGGTTVTIYHIAQTNL